MGRTTSLVAVFLLCFVSALAVLVASPLDETAALSEPPTSSETPSLEAPESLAMTRLGAPLDFTPGFSVSLPIVMRGYNRRCSSDSPFSIEIAAIHQVVLDEEWDTTERGMAEAEWLERIEEGYPSLVEALADSGACWTRVELKWSQIQPEPPPAPYNFTFFDSKLQLLAGSGVQTIAVVHSVPYWAGEDSAGPIYPERMDDFAQFLNDLVSRYRKLPYNVHHWELFNEPDSIDGWGLLGDEYAAMLASAYPKIKTVDPAATVLMGGLAHDWFTEYDGPFYRYFPDDVAAGAGSELHVDATNFHFFPAYAAEWERWNSPDTPTCGIVDDGLGTPYEAGGIDVIAKASHFRNRLLVCSGVDRPIWLTELGEHGFEGNLPSLGQQARYVLQGYARALAAGIENVTWYALVSPPYDPYQQGLLYEDDWSPKPAFYTYQTMTRELTGYRYVSTLSVPLVEGYVFRNSSGHEKVVAWSWGPVYQSGSLTFAPATKLRVVDRDGQVTLIQDGGPGDMDQIPASVTIRLPAVPPVPDPALLLRYTAEPLIISKW